MRESVSRTLSADYVLKPLTSKFLRLALQIIHRYNSSSPLRRLRIDNVQGKLEKLLDPEDLPTVLDMFQRVLGHCPTGNDEHELEIGGGVLQEPSMEGHQA